MMKMVINCSKLRASTHTKPSFLVQHVFTAARNRAEIVNVCKGNLSVYNSKTANLSAARKQRIKLPNSDGGCHFNEFLSESSGIEAVLNTRALQSFYLIDANTYRCVLPKLQLLNFEAAPVLELKVTPTDESCTVELLSCKFRGSDVVERQNEHFTAFMMNCMSWDINGPEPFLEVDVRLNLTLEIYTRPFTLLPTAAVEQPGNMWLNRGSFVELQNDASSCGSACAAAYGSIDERLRQVGEPTYKCSQIASQEFMNIKMQDEGVCRIKDLKLYFARRSIFGAE